MTSRSLLVLASLVVLALVSRPAVADVKPENVFAGKIITSDKRFPTKAKSGSAFVAAIRKQTKTQFMEDKKAQTWRIYYAAFFRKPLADIEVVVKLYDPLAGSAPVASFEQYLDERGGRTLLSDFTLDRRNVKDVNRELIIVLEVAGQAVAKGKFKILGEEEHYSGKVDFSEDETDE
jgi:hypothetical protein